MKESMDKLTAMLQEIDHETQRDEHWIYKDGYNNMKTQLGNAIAIGIEIRKWHRVSQVSYMSELPVKGYILEKLSFIASSLGYKLEEVD